MTATPLPPVALRDTVIAALRRIAPEISPDKLESSRALREQVDLDSMDWLNFLIALNTKVGVDIPESDYAKLVTLDDLILYLERKLQSTRPIPPDQPAA